MSLRSDDFNSVGGFYTDEDHPQLVVNVRDDASFIPDLLSFCCTCSRLQLAPSDGLPRVTIRSLSEAQRTCRELVRRVDPTLWTQSGSRAPDFAVRGSTFTIRLPGIVRAIGRRSSACASWPPTSAAIRQASWQRQRPTFELPSRSR